MSQGKPRLYPAALASLLVATGAGHVAIGHTRRGLIWFIAELIGVVVAMLGTLINIHLLWVAAAWLLALRVTALFDVLGRPAAPSLPRWGRVVLIWIALIAGNQLVSFAMRAFVIEAFKIPSGAMIPTLQIGDHIFANKLPFTPRRGDIIVFDFPKQPRQQFIKRVIAVGGDEIEIRDDVVFINGNPVERRRLDEDCHYSDYDESMDQWTAHACDAWEENLDGKRYRVIFDRERSPHSTHPVRVPPDSYFVLGDNRDNSHDSRYWGFVPRSLLEGRAYMIWWSSGESGTRWDRLLLDLR
jgi:signal peptidase I